MVDMDAIVSNSVNLEIVTEIYAAQQLVVEVDTKVEKGYLGMQTVRLYLPSELSSELEPQVKTPRASA